MEKTNIKVLGIFGNIDTSNASSILIKSLIKNLPKKIRLEYYKINDQVKINSINQYSLFYAKSVHYDKYKKNIELNEIKNIGEMEEKIKLGSYNIIFGWSNPYIASTIAIELGKKFDIPVILRLGDFSVCSNSIGMFNNYKYAKKIIVPNEKLQKKVIKFYGEKHKDKIIVISQHYCPYVFKNIKMKESNIINIIHTGNMYLERKIDLFIDVLSRMDNNLLSRIKIKFIGCHDKLNEDIELCKKFNINCDFTQCYQFENWYFTKSMGYEEMREEISNADILLHIEYVCSNNHFLSFKLIDYLSYGIPIITLTQKDSPNYLLAKECGIGFGDIEDKHQMKESINKILLEPEKFIPNENKLKYKIDNVINKWIKIFEQNDPK